MYIYRVYFIAPDLSRKSVSRSGGDVLGRRIASGIFQKKDFLAPAGGPTRVMPFRSPASLQSFFGQLRGASLLCLATVPALTDPRSE